MHILSSTGPWPSACGVCRAYGAYTWDCRGGDPPRHMQKSKEKWLQAAIFLRFLHIRAE